VREAVHVVERDLRIVRGVALLRARTTTTVPVLTRSYRSMTSSLVMRMQPDDTAAPMRSGWLVPWMRYSVSFGPRCR